MTKIFKMPEQQKEAYEFFIKNGYSITERDNHRVYLTREWVEGAIKLGMIKDEKNEINDAL